MSEKVKVRWRRTRSPHHRVVYSNQINMQGTPADVRFRFGAIEDVNDGVITVEDQVDVILPVNELVALYALIAAHLKGRGIDPDAAAGPGKFQIDEPIEVVAEKIE